MKSLNLKYICYRMKIYIKTSIHAEIQNSGVIKKNKIAAFDFLSVTPPLGKWELTALPFQPHKSFTKHRW